MSTAQGGGFHLFAALFMLRFFGQGSMMNVSVYQINLWWIKRRGAMMGVAGAVVSSMMLASQVLPTVRHANRDMVRLASPPRHFPNKDMVRLAFPFSSRACWRG